MRKNITFNLIIFLIFGTINLFAEETNIQTEQQPQENISGTGWNNFVNGFVTAYKTIENGVVTGYKAVENGVVNAYKAIENWFTRTFNIPVPERLTQIENSSSEAEEEN